MQSIRQAAGQASTSSADSARRSTTHPASAAAPSITWLSRAVVACQPCRPSANGSARASADPHHTVWPALRTKPAPSIRARIPSRSKNFPHDGVSDSGSSGSPPAGRATTTTRRPQRASSRAAVAAAGPPPTTSTSHAAFDAAICNGV